MSIDRVSQFLDSFYATCNAATVKFPTSNTKILTFELNGTNYALLNFKDFFERKGLIISRHKKLKDNSFTGQHKSIQRLVFEDSNRYFVMERADFLDILDNSDSNVIFSETIPRIKYGSKESKFV